MICRQSLYRHFCDTTKLFYLSHFLKISVLLIPDGHSGHKSAAKLTAPHNGGVSAPISIYGSIPKWLGRRIKHGEALNTRTTGRLRDQNLAIHNIQLWTSVGTVQWDRGHRREHCRSASQTGSSIIKISKFKTVNSDNDWIPRSHLFYSLKVASAGTWVGFSCSKNSTTTVFSVRARLVPSSCQPRQLVGLFGNDRFRVPHKTIHHLHAFDPSPCAMRFALTS